MARGPVSLQASVQLQACWGGFLGSDYPFPTDFHTGGGFGGSFAPAGPNQFGFAVPAAPTGLFLSGFADVPEYGVLTPLRHRDAPTGLLGYGSLQFPPGEAFRAAPFFGGSDDMTSGMPASGLCYQAPFPYGSFDPGLPPMTS